MDDVKSYALKILADAGCDCYTYGGEFCTCLLNDLKTEYPKGMKYPYVDVANAIYEISRPRPIMRAPFRVYLNLETCEGRIDSESFEGAKAEAEDILCEWMMEEVRGWAYDMLPDGTTKPRPTEEQKESWDYMINNCSVGVYKYNPMTDGYEFNWEPTQKDLDDIGWKPFSAW